MFPDDVWPPFPPIVSPTQSSLSLADALARWAKDTLDHQAACLALAQTRPQRLMSLAECQAWVERICQALLASARAAQGQSILFLEVDQVGDCPDDLLPSIVRLQELASLGLLAGARLALPGILATRIAVWLAPPRPPLNEQAAPCGDTTGDEDTPLLPGKRGDRPSERCVIS